MRRSSVTTRVSQGQVLAAMSDWEDASPITKEDLAALTNEELATVAAMNNFLSQMLGGRSAELHYMGQYEFASHSKTLKELSNHIETAQFETECLKKMIGKEEASRSQMAKAAELYKEWFALLCDGYFQAVRDTAKGREPFSLSASRRQRKQSLKKWGTFKKNLERACATEAPSEDCLGLPGVKLLCDLSSEERSGVKK